MQGIAEEIENQADGGIENLRSRLRKPRRGEHRGLSEFRREETRRQSLCEGTVRVDGQEEKGTPSWGCRGLTVLQPLILLVIVDVPGLTKA